MAEVDVIRAAAAAGVQPNPGRLGDMADRATGASSVVLLGLFAYAGHSLVENGTLSWRIAAAGVVVACVLLWLVTRWRMVRLIEHVPAAGVRRLLSPAFYVYAIAGGIVGLVGLAALAYLYPYDVERAEQLRITIGMGETNGFDAGVAVELIRFWGAVAAFAPFAAVGLFWLAWVAHTANGSIRPLRR